MDKIPHELIINWDQMRIHYVPVGSWTMEKEGTKKVEIIGVDDKRQITAVLAGSLAEDFLSSPPTHIQRYYKAMSTNGSISPKMACYI